MSLIVRLPLDTVTAATADAVRADVNAARDAILAGLAAHQFSTDAELLALAGALASLSTQVGSPSQAAALTSARDQILAAISSGSSTDFGGFAR